jgi:O-antigen ligase
MTSGPGALPPTPLHEVREAAQRQARQLPASLVLALAIAVSLTAIIAFVALDYRFDQDPHRIVKLLIGVALVGSIVLRPWFGLLLLPIVTPFLGWMPRVPIPGINPLNVLLVSVFLTWAVGRVLRHEDVFRPSRLGSALGLLFLLGMLSIVRGGAFPTGYEYRVREGIYALIRCGMTFTVYFIALAMARGERARRLLSWSIVVALIAEAAVTIAYGRNGKGARALGSFGQSNELGAFLAMFSAFAIAMLPGTRRLLAKALLVVATAGGVFAALLSVSRGAMVALVAGLLYVGLRSSKLLTVVVLATLITSPLWAPQYVKDRIVGTEIESPEGGDVELEGAAQLRVDTWKAIAELVSSHPLDGVGFDGLGYVLPETGTELGLEVKDSSHNTYLRFLGEMGIGGLLVFLLLLWRCFRLAEDGIRYARSRFDRQLAVGVGAATVAMAASCAFGDRFLSILITGNYWIACALVNDALLERRDRT